MRIYRLLRLKWLYLFSIIVLLMLTYWDGIWHWLTFDVNAPDLASLNAVELNNMIFISNFRIDISLYNLGFYTSFFFPIFIAIISYDYLTIKNKYLKMFIGKNERYSSELLRTKFKLSFIPIVVYSLVFLSVVLLSLMFNALSFEEYTINTLFDASSILQNIVNGPFSYLFIYWFLTAFGIFVNSLFMLKICDAVNNHVRASLVYLGFIWFFSIVIYRFCPFYFSPMTSIMIMSYKSLTLYQLFLPYLFILCVFIALKRMPYEV